MKVVDNLVAARIIALLNMPFTKWNAYSMGIINENGDTLRAPANKAERYSWSYVHRTVRKVKRMLQSVSGATIGSNIQKLSEDLSASELAMMSEALVAGATVNAFSGETTGAITREPGGFDKKRKKKKKKDKKKKGNADELREDRSEVATFIEELNMKANRGIVLTPSSLDDILSRATNILGKNSAVSEQDLDDIERAVRRMRHQ